MSFYCAYEAREKLLEKYHKHGLSKEEELRLGEASEKVEM
jgi:hypothetical protein